MDEKGASGYMWIMFALMATSLGVVFLWNSVPLIKDLVHGILDPSAGALINWNTTWGMLILVLIISIVTTFVQKFATDQKTLRELKAEQKAIQEEMKRYREHPEKMMEFNKQSMALMPKIMSITMKGSFFTIIPFVLLFRWFMEFFSQPAFESFKFFGFLNWFWFYLIFTMIFSGFLRKWFDVA